MRVLFSAPNVDIDGRFGDSTHVRELAKNLSDQNNEVDVLAKKKDSIPENYNFSLKIVNFDVPYNFLTMPLYFFIYILPKTFLLMIKNNYQCVYERHYIFDFSCIIGNILGIFTLVEVNGLLIEESKELNKYGRVYYFFAQTWEKFVFSIADKIIIGSNELKSVLVDEYKVDVHKIEIIENGANTDLFEPIENSKEKLNLDRNSKYICFVGNIVSWQGLNKLIECAPFILEKVPYAKFLIVGGGSEDDLFRKQVEKSGYKDYFILTGNVRYRDVPLYINASDVCITLKKELKSGYSPTKLYEYMACGKPVIASNYSGHKILSKYNAGLLVDPENVSEVSHAIIMLLEDDYLSICLGKNARNAALDQFSWKRVAQDINAILHSL